MFYRDIPILYSLHFQTGKGFRTRDDDTRAYGAGVLIKQEVSLKDIYRLYLTFIF